MVIFSVTVHLLGDWRDSTGLFSPTGKGNTLAQGVIFCWKRISDTNLQD